jgi:hypothetical protein
MVGVRGDTTWITRLGITPKGRRQGLGRRLMEAALATSRQLPARRIILEVIKNNGPARALFERFGFQTTRELLVIRRPPTPVHLTLSGRSVITALGPAETLELLHRRTDAPSWVTASESMGKAGQLGAFVADLPNLGRGWLAYQNSTFQLSRILIETEAEASLEVATTLLQYLHQQFPFKDTIVENLAATDRHWPVFQALGYLTSFVRVEMALELPESSPEGWLNGYGRP